MDHPLRLVPVVGLEADRFSSRPRPSWDDPVEGPLYWARCLADAGIEGLVPVEGAGRPWDRLVPVDQLTGAKLLEAIVRADLSLDASEQLRTGEHVVSDLDGGFALFSGDELMIDPRCCAALCSLSDWKHAAAYDGEEWAPLWVGHPMAGVRREGARLVFCGDYDSGPEPYFDVDPGALAGAIEEAERALGAFAGRLAAALAPWIGDEAAGQAARVMAGLEGHTHFEWGTPEPEEDVTPSPPPPG